MYLFFDTETTGLPRNYKAPVSDLSNWPRVVQIAWLLADAQGNELSSSEYIVKPKGFSIPSEASDVHGITTQIALRDGVDLEVVIAAFMDSATRASALVAHNMEFDEKILGAELLRGKHPNILLSKKRLCTMQSSTDYCQLRGRYGYKWPTLQELHKKLFNKTFGEAHRALVDVRACARCYFELRRLKIMA